MEGVTDASRKLFGTFLWHCAQREGFTSQEQLAKHIKEKTRINVNESAINAIVAARWSRSFNFEHMIAIVEAHVLKFEDGTSLEYNHVMDILRDKLDPFTQTRLENGAQSVL